MKPLRLKLATYSSTATALLGGMRLGALLLLGPVPKYISSAVQEAMRCMLLQ
jgi:hypothetical protein